MENNAALLKEISKAQAEASENAKEVELVKTAYAAWVNEFGPEITKDIAEGATENTTDKTEKSSPIKNFFNRLFRTCL